MASLFTAGLLQACFLLELLLLLLLRLFSALLHGPEFSGWSGGSASGEAFHLMVLPDLGALASSSGRWRGDGVKIRVEGQGEISYAQTITMGSKPQNIYLFRLNGSIKWTPAMFLA